MFTERFAISRLGLKMEFIGVVYLLATKLFVRTTLLLFNMIVNKIGYAVLVLVSFLGKEKVLHCVFTLFSTIIEADSFCFHKFCFFLQISQVISSTVILFFWHSYIKLGNRHRRQSFVLFLRIPSTKVAKCSLFRRYFYYMNCIQQKIPFPI